VVIANTRPSSLAELELGQGYANTASRRREANPSVGATPQGIAKLKSSGVVRDVTLQEINFSRNRLTSSSEQS
jgi:hypothetical protein